MNQLMINTQSRIQDDIEDFRLDRLDEKDNYTVAQVKLCRRMEDDTPLLFYSQDLSRNFREANDPLGSKRILKVFTPANHEAVADETLTHKFKDTVLAFKNHIPDYSPLSDVHSDKMKLFMDESTAQFVSDIGVNVDGLGQDFSEMESVPATPFMEDVSLNASSLKSEQALMNEKLTQIKVRIADEFDDYLDPVKVTDDEFAQHMALENVPNGLVQQYLSVSEDIKELKSKLGEVNQVVFSETSSRIKLPARIKEMNYGLFK